jgi:hypothetical protein
MWRKAAMAIMNTIAISVFVVVAVDLELIKVRTPSQFSSAVPKTRVEELTNDWHS